MQLFKGASFNSLFFGFADLMEWPSLKILQNIEAIDNLLGDSETLGSLPHRRYFMALNHPGTAELPLAKMMRSWAYCQGISLSVRSSVSGSG